MVDDDFEKRIARDLHDWAEVQRERADTIDEIADALENGLTLEDAYARAKANQQWSLADVLRPFVGENP